MDLNIEDLNKVISTFVSNNCSDKQTEQCLKKFILYTSENDILLSHLSSILISAKNQVNCLFKSLTALHYTINKGDQKFLHYLASNNLNFVNLDKNKHKFSNVNLEYLNFLKKYLKYLQQKIGVYKILNMESSWLTKLTQKNKNVPIVKTDESVLQHDIIGEQLMRKIGFIENQIDYLITEFSLINLNELIQNNEILDNNDYKTKTKLIELVINLLLNDIIKYANYYQDIMSELIEQFELMNRKHCKDAIEVYRKLPDKIQILRKFIANCNQNLMEINGFQQIDLNELIEPNIELQEKMEHHWKILESKPKRKNSERRKEKSKYAARVRRSEESDLLTELSELVPLPDVKTQDKASVMRLAIAFINTKQFAQSYFQLNNSIKKIVTNTKNDDILFDDQMDCLDVLKTSNLILTLLTLDGDLVFISPNVINLIGLKQTEMLGMSIFDFVHPCDHDELRNSLKQITEQTNLMKNNANKSTSIELNSSTDNFNNTNKNENLFKDSKYVSFMVRIKCTLNNKSKCVPLKSANYKMANFSGYLKESKNRPLLVLSVDILLSPSAQLKLKCTNSSVFVTKHTPDLKFVNTDETLTNLFGYEEKDLIGYSFFQYIHASDAFQLFNSFQKLLSKGEVETGYYRMLCKTGGYFWIQTKASLLTDYSTQKPQTILCVHYLISELISSGIILSNKQCLPSENTNENLDENSIQQITATSNKKGQRLTKKTKTNQSKITKVNLNTKVDKCYSPIKTTNTNRKSIKNNLISPLSVNNSTDELFVLEDSNNLKKNNLVLDKLVDDENSLNSFNQCQPCFDNNFVHECEEFDQVLKKIKFKEQFKKEYEAQLNKRMTKQIIEPLFNTDAVFEPIDKDNYIQVEPTIENSPLIATPDSIAYADKVDMACLPSFDCLSSPIPVKQSISELSNDLSNDMSCNLNSYDLNSSTMSGGFETCELFESTNLNTNNYIPEIDEFKTTIGNTNSIFSPITDDLSNSGFYLTCIEDELSNDKNVDFDNMNLIHLAPEAGDSMMNLDVSLDFDELPINLDSETEKLIKESFGANRNNNLRNSNLNSVQNNLIKTNSTIQYENSNKKLLEFDNYYLSNSKAVKIPNHFNNLESETIKKPRTSLNFQSSNHPLQHQQSKFTNSKFKNPGSVLLSLLINDVDLNNSYLNK